MSSQAWSYMGGRSTLRAAIVVALTLAWPAVAQDVAAPFIEDPEGDARDHDSQMAPDALTDIAGINWRETDPGIPRAGGIPAPPHLDILRVDLVESTSYLDIALHLAYVPEVWEDILPQDEGIRYVVCWQWGNGVCIEGVIRHPARFGGVVIDYPEYFVQDAACSPRNCIWAVGSWLEPGSPGAIHWRIPRDAMPARPEGEMLREGEARTGRILRSATVLAPQGIPVGSGGFAAGRPFVAWDVDIATANAPYVLTKPAGAYRPEPFRPVVAPAGLAVGDPVDELDLLGLDLVETPTELTVSMKIAQVEEVPRDHTAAFRLAFQRGSYIFGSVNAAANESTRSMTLVVCSRTDTVASCANAPLNGTLSVVTGSPGWVNVTFDRVAAGVPATDARAGLFDAAIRGVKVAPPLTIPQPVFADPSLDATPMAAPFTLRYDTGRAPTPAGSITLEDAVADAATVDGPDLQRLELRQLVDGHVEAQFTLSPLPEELLLAAELDTLAGARMIAARVSDGQITGYCGPDTLVTQRDPTAPTDARADVTGRIIPGRPALVILEGPSECFGLPPGVAIEGHRAGAILLTAAEVPVLHDLVLALGDFSLAPNGVRTATAVPVGLSPLLVSLLLFLLGLALIILILLLVRARRVAATAAPIVGQVFLKRYRIDRVLGEGSFGAAWLAYDRRARKPVVLKLAHPGAGAAALERFREEAKLLARAAHPHVTRLYRVETGGGRDYMVMEYVAGGTLEGALQRGLRRDEAESVILDVLDGLHHVHTQGVIHRDVKPANVLLTSEGRAKLADFGVARGHDMPVTIQASSPVGTPQFIAPEALAGLATDARGDLYATGVLARLALGGARGAPLDPRYGAWIARATERDPARRFATAQEMRDEFLRARAAPAA